MVLKVPLGRRGGVTVIRKEEEFALMLDSLLRKKKRIFLHEAIKEFGLEHNPNTSRIMTNVAWLFCCAGWIRLEDKQGKGNGKFPSKWRLIIGYSPKGIAWFDKVYLSRAHQKMERLVKAKPYWIITDDKTGDVSLSFDAGGKNRVAFDGNGSLLTEVLALFKSGVRTNSSLKRKTLKGTMEDTQKAIDWMVEKGFWKKIKLYREEDLAKIGKLPDSIPPQPQAKPL